MSQSRSRTYETSLRGGIGHSSSGPPQRGHMGGRPWRTARVSSRSSWGEKGSGVLIRPGSRGGPTRSGGKAIAGPRGPT